MYIKLANQANVVFAMSSGFLGKNQEFSVSEKTHLQTFLYGNHPNDSLIMKVTDKIMGTCIKITWCKNHDNMFFCQCENASTINFLYGSHPNITPSDYENSQKPSWG